MNAAKDTDMTSLVPQPQDPNDYSDLLQTAHSDAFAFSDQEVLVLKLYDQLRELELQQSLIEAQNTSKSSFIILEVHLITAEREAMEARAEHELRNRITRNVLVMDPVLKAVHGGEHTGYAEKKILPLITERDALSMIHANLASRLASKIQALNAAEEGNIAANRVNRELSRTLLALAGELRSQSTQDIEDPKLRDRVQVMDKNVRDVRRRMKTLKGILSGMIVGSGLDWAADETLRELVMDDEDG
ncbi:hypothetical protein CC78DRAFT_581088 [Lojkania enalia]|uniref:Centromere protein H C-terminal domain-containing protein n=1 Tax=Lojkania enalia TaxID=147567 RepID=A0A9P4K6G1_9PLEO|nr:hypothetical protein CC78DRAFT_581088 [Didymosphaeria enalia]